MELNLAKSKKDLESFKQYTLMYALFEPHAEPFTEEPYFTAFIYAKVLAKDTKDKEDVVIMLAFNHLPSENLLDKWAAKQAEDKPWQSELDELLAQVLTVQ